AVPRVRVVVRAVAVVVLAVARLGLRLLPADALEPAVHAAEVAAGAEALVHAARVADLLGRIVGVRRAVDAVGPGARLVGDAVAVVVDPVADLGLRTAAALAAGAVAARLRVADEHAELARAGREDALAGERLLVVVG